MPRNPAAPTDPLQVHGHVHGPDCHHDHDAVPETYRRETPKLGRNDPCYCGSGRKFKKCHGASR